MVLLAQRTSLSHSHGPGGGPPGVMRELAEELMGLELPRGLIVGSAVISHCTPVPGAPAWQWHLADVQRIARPRKPTRHPQPVWFRPF